MRKITMTGRAVLGFMIPVFALGIHAQSPGPAVKPGIDWKRNLKTAFELAARQNKPLMVEFMAEWCPSCRMMEDSTFADPGVIEKTGRFIPVRIDVDRQKDVADRYKSSARKYGGIGIPNILFMTPGGVGLKHRIGYMDAAALTAVMDSVLTGVKPSLIEKI
jgi:thiol:disulfide interchange protein